MGGRGSAGIERKNVINDTPLYEMTHEQMEQEYNDLKERRKTDNSSKVLTRYMELKRALEPESINNGRKRNYQTRGRQSRYSI